MKCSSASLYACLLVIVAGLILIILGIIDYRRTNDNTLLLLWGFFGATFITIGILVPFLYFIVNGVMKVCKVC